MWLWISRFCGIVSFGVDFGWFLGGGSEYGGNTAGEEVVGWHGDDAAAMVLLGLWRGVRSDWW